MNRKWLLIPLMACMALVLMGSAPLRLAPNAPTIPSDQAVMRAVNQWTAIPGGYRLQHPRHTVEFTAQGLRFAPRQGSLTWDWQLTYIGTASAVLAQADLGAVAPANETGGLTYRRGVISEQYIAQQQSIEQRFVIAEPLALGGADLLVAGAIRSEGAFETLSDSWLWRAESSGVRLSGVRVYDAKGTVLPATMTVTAQVTRIVVDGAALASAAYPVTIDPEIGTNDLRISFMGEDDLYDGYSPAVAFNSTANEYLVVWYGDDNGGSLIDGEDEIWGQRVSAVTGERVGSNFRISDMGGLGNANYDALYPDVAYDSTNNEYLVVWEADDDTAPLVQGETEIFGQRLTASGGGTGTNDFRISDMGTNGDVNYDAHRPAVAYNSHDNEYLVVWYGDNDTLPLVNEEFEIYGQRLNAATGAETGTSDFRISSMGGLGSAVYNGYAPDVAYNSTNNEYLVVWYGDDDIAPLVNDEYEIFGQLLTATGTGHGPDDFRISDMGPNGDTTYDAFYPAVAYNSTNNEYLVVWYGDDDTGSLVHDEYEIYGQRVTADGAETGTNDFRISSMGPDGNIAYDAVAPDVAYNSTNNEYLVVWQGDDNTGSLVVDEDEVFGQRLNAATGAAVGTNDFRISDMGPDGSTSYAASSPAVAYNSVGDTYQVVWHGDENIAPLVNDENEIFGQGLSGAGAAVGENDARVSFLGEDDLYDAQLPAVAYNSTNNEYLVVWYGDDNSGSLVDTEDEIWAQRVNAATGERVGSNYRISSMGGVGDATYDAQHPDVAYNSTNNEYLVVWDGDDNVAPLVEGETEIFGQRLNGTNGSEVGADDFRISDAGPDGNTSYYASYPAVAYNSHDNEYLVVWYGNNSGLGLVVGEQEIWGQRLNAATGAAVGTNDFRISGMGGTGDANYNAYAPDVAYNSTNNEYLVVWHGDDNNAPLVNDEYEIFGQRLTAAGGATGADDFRISDMGTDGSTLYRASAAAVAYNSTNNEYLVVWYGDDNTGSLVDDENEIWGQRLNAATGAAVGTNDFRISGMGGTGDANYDGTNPDVAYDSTANQYLVVWHGDDNIAPLVNDEFEIFGQRLTAAGVSTGANDFRLSDMGPDGGGANSANVPRVAFNSSRGEYLVVWYGDENIAPLVNDEFEIFAQLYTSTIDLDLPFISR